MAEVPRVDPLAALAAKAPDGGAVRLASLPAATRVNLRGDPAMAGAAFSIVPGAAINRATIAGDRAALMLGPDEWLLIGPDAPLPELPAGAVDVSHGSAAIEVAGPFAVPALNGFVALDLAEAAFPVGMCTRTILGKAEIVLWRTGPETFRIEVARSFAPYVWLCLEEARREFL